MTLLIIIGNTGKIKNQARKRRISQLVTAAMIMSSFTSLCNVFILSIGTVDTPKYKPL